MRPADPRNRLHHKHPDQAPLQNTRANVNPFARGGVWTPIIPLTGALFHGYQHAIVTAAREQTNPLLTASTKKYIG